MSEVPLYRGWSQLSFSGRRAPGSFSYLTYKKSHPPRTLP